MIYWFINLTRQQPRHISNKQCFILHFCLNQERFIHILSKYNKYSKCNISFILFVYYIWWWLKKNLRILWIELSEMPLYSMGNIVRRFLVYYLVFKMCKKSSYIHLTAKNAQKYYWKKWPYILSWDYYNSACVHILIHIIKDQ